MRGFKFSLDKVLETRKHQEKLAQQQFAQALQLCRIEEQQLASIRRELSQAKSTYYSAGQRMAARDLQLVHHYIESLVNSESTQFTKYQAACRKLKVARDELIEVQRKRKVLERLRDKQLARYRQEYNRMIQKQLDEVAQQMFVRR